jgi:flagellar biosynthesis anti-sigma factor FlgM
MAHTNGIGSQPLLNNLIDRTERTAATAQSSNNPKSVTVRSVGSQGDAARLSGAGSVLAAGSASGDVRSDKVAALKTAINAGTYSVPTADVADKLIQTMVE